MRWLLRIVLFLAGTILLALIVGFCWLYFYSRDLPDINTLAQYAPANTTQVSDACLGNSIAIPYEAIGSNMRNVISVVETNENDPGALRTTIHDLLMQGELPQRRTMVASWYISRSMCYRPQKSLSRQLSELRTATQLERHYSRRQLFTMYANRAPLGQGLIGVYDAGAFYFHKKPGELAVSEAALLVGLANIPSFYSPLKHPDRALKRRNQMIDALVEAGMITMTEAQEAKSAPLGLAVNATGVHK